MKWQGELLGAELTEQVRPPLASQLVQAKYIFVLNFYSASFVLHQRITPVSKRWRGTLWSSPLRYLIFHHVSLINVMATQGHVCTIKYGAEQVGRVREWASDSLTSK